FALPDGGPLPFHHTAGQYLNIALPIEGKTVKRSYTISSSPMPDYVEISVKRAPAGYGSHYLHDKVSVGDRIKISAPGGKFHFPGVTGKHADKRVVLLAGGVGITPMMSVIRSLTAAKWPGDMYLVFGVRTRDDVIFADEIKAIAAANPNVHVTLHYSSEHGHITADILRAAVPDFTHGPVMMCGPGPMMVAMRSVLVGMGIPNAEIHEEAFVSPPSSPEGAQSFSDAADTSMVDPEATRGYAFKRAKKSVELPGGLTVLEAAEDCGVEIPFDCRSGICGQCKCTLVSGRVVMESTDALTAKDRTNNIVLACQAIPISDVVLDV
ncbi:MAG TPA: iron-sulfur cluster-binding domain-containing protein, partial [Kofleriaceae bacterium]